MCVKGGKHTFHKRTRISSVSVVAVSTSFLEKARKNNARIELAGATTALIAASGRGRTSLLQHVCFGVVDWIVLECLAAWSIGGGADDGEGS